MDKILDFLKRSNRYKHLIAVSWWHLNAMCINKKNGIEIPLKHGIEIPSGGSSQTQGMTHTTAKVQV